MMNDDDYYNDQYQQSVRPNMGRWAIFLLVAFLGIAGIYGIIISYPVEAIFWTMFIYFPMVVFLLYYTFRWAQGRDVSGVNRDQDDEILESMRKHAIPIERAELSDTIRCPNCAMMFELVNAIPVETDVFLCPFCNTRLHIR